MPRMFGFNCDNNSLIEYVFKNFIAEKYKKIDGRGYAYYTEGKWYIYKEVPDLSEGNRIESTIEYPRKISCSTFISHVRKASIGKRVIENTHPFDLDIYDKKWLFAHYGHLRLYRFIHAAGGHFSPLGETDSESAFCTLMNEISSLGRHVKDYKIIHAIQKKAEELIKSGGLNFLLSPGEILYAYYSGYKSLYYATHVIEANKELRAEDQYVFFKLKTFNNDLQISFVSSEPFIDNIDWRKLEPGEVYSFKDGKRWKPFIPK
ncbi:MAG: class II glutamine amidotransferase [Candidatus Heimdallarchaeaceae archaeon]